MKLTAGQLATLLNGEIEGNAETLLHTVAKIEEGFEGALSFLANMKYEPHLYTTQSSAVLVNRDFKPSEKVNATLIRVDNAYSAFTFLLEQYASQSVQSKKGIEANAFVHPTAQLGEDVYIGAGAFIAEGVVIGKNSKIFPNVSIGQHSKVGDNCIINSNVSVYHECSIGNHCIIHSGTVIGSDGFGFAPQADRSYKKIPQTGNVIIEDQVEIGANCSIDRATMGSTIIRRGVKLDNLVQIAHNVEIGEHTVIAAQTGIAGSTKIGRFCIIAGQVGFVGHITIADGSQIGAQSGINSSIRKPDSKWFGTPAFELSDALKSSVFFKKLPELNKRITELEKALKELTDKTNK